MDTDVRVTITKLVSHCSMHHTLSYCRKLISPNVNQFVVSALLAGANEHTLLDAAASDTSHTATFKLLSAFEVHR